MDIISHSLIGKILSIPYKNSRKRFIGIIFFSVLADIISIPLYFYVGQIKNRFLWLPQNNDWIGLRELHPYWSLFYDIPHSFFFLLLIIIPLAIFFRIPKITIIAYLLHLLTDLFTHTGEWALKPFYPLNYKFEGLTDAWAWPLSSMIISWLILFFIIFLFSLFFSKKSFYKKEI